MRFFGNIVADFFEFLTRIAHSDAVIGVAKELCVVQFVAESKRVVGRHMQVFLQIRERKPLVRVLAVNIKGANAVVLSPKPRAQGGVCAQYVPEIF